MKTLVGVYGSHDEAVGAVDSLKKSGYPESQISLVTKADLVNNHIHVKSNDTVEKAEISIGVAAGTALGILTGVGIFAIPGLGFLFGAGAAVGIIAGVDFGIIGGGLVAIFTALGINAVNSVKYERHLNEGKFLVFAQGSDSEVNKAEDTLGNHGLHLELDRY